MYNFNYEYMTFLYAVHVYTGMFCNVVLYCIALPARVLFAKKIIIIYIIIIMLNLSVFFFYGYLIRLSLFPKLYYNTKNRCDYLIK